MVPVYILELPRGHRFDTGSGAGHELKQWMQGPAELIQGLLGGKLAALSGIRSAAGAGRSSNSGFRRDPTWRGG